MPDNVPDAMFAVLDAAAALKPDLVLLSEMATRDATESTRKVAALVAERARRMNAYILIGGLDIDERPKGIPSTSHACLWDRTGQRVFKEPIYWSRGFSEIRVFDTDFARIGVHTCGDLYVGEVDRVLALKGAEIILDPSRMWGADGYHNETMLRARAIDNGCWVACAHWNSSDPGLRSVIVDPYGYTMAASKFQEHGAICLDIDFDAQKVYYAGRKARQEPRDMNHIFGYTNEDLPEQRPGWRAMIFARRRPELYGLLPSANEATRKLRRDDMG
jgi:predicted amidohydrolase